MTSTLEDLPQQGIDTVFIASVDMQGRLFGRRLPIEAVKRAADWRLSVSTCALGWDYAQDVGMNARFTGIHTGWHDAALRPDFSALYCLPWLDRTALMFADVVDVTSDEEVRVAPRSILKRLLGRASEKGLEFKTATELEFYLFRCSYSEAASKSYRGLTPTTRQRSQDLIDHSTNLIEPFFGELRRSLQKARLEILYTEAEWGRGQWEINVGHATALQTADAQIVLKLAIKDIASKHGLAATFMAKPSYDDVGSSCHVNASAWAADGRSLFYAPEASPPLSKTLLGAVGGLLAHAPDLALWYAPTINSYKRLEGQQFAGNGQTWAIDNRTVTCRVVGTRAETQRVEFRLPGADANPYLLLAGTLGATANGIEHELDPGPAAVGNSYAETRKNDVPSSLAGAAERFAQSKFIAETFGADIAEHYTLLAQYELRQFQRTVTDWELNRYFENA
jgi:glutamine synthetase